MTYSSNVVREAPARWSAADREGDLGLSARVGLTPTVTLDATVNPDFSQVESDAFQVEVKQRFPVFFSEKRPFFMEGAGLFTLAGSGMDSSMIAAVHTRRIVNPKAGIKLTGSADSASRDAARAGREGFAASASWLGYSARRQQIQGFFEHYDRGFLMDTAFYNRVGITSGWGYTDWSFYPDSAGTYRWIRRIVPFVFTQHGQDRLAGGDETVVVPGVRMNFTRQGFLRIDKIMGHERWQGGRYPLSRARVQGEVQHFRWMRLSGRADWGAATFYDETAPFRGLVAIHVGRRVTRTAGIRGRGLGPRFRRLRHDPAGGFKASYLYRF